MYAHEVDKFVETVPDDVPVRNEGQVVKQFSGVKGKDLSDREGHDNYEEYVHFYEIHEHELK